jgi:hypothetical protein
MRWPWGQWADAYVEVGRELVANGLDSHIDKLHASADSLVGDVSKTVVGDIQYMRELLRLACRARHEDLRCWLYRGSVDVRFANGRLWHVFGQFKNQLVPWRNAPWVKERLKRTALPRMENLTGDSSKADLVGLLPKVNAHLATLRALTAGGLDAIPDVMDPKEIPEVLQLADALEALIAKKNALPNAAPQQMTAALIVEEREYRTRLHSYYLRRRVGPPEPAPEPEPTDPVESLRADIRLRRNVNRLHVLARHTHLVDFQAGIVALRELWRKKILSELPPPPRKIENKADADEAIDDLERALNDMERKQVAPQAKTEGKDSIEEIAAPDEDVIDHPTIRPAEESSPLRLAEVEGSVFAGPIVSSAASDDTPALSEQDGSTILSEKQRSVIESERSSASVTDQGRPTAREPKYSEWAFGQEDGDRWHTFRHRSGRWEHQGLLNGLDDKLQALMSAFAKGNEVVRLDDLINIRRTHPGAAESKRVQNLIKPEMTRLRNVLLLAMNLPRTSAANIKLDPLPPCKEPRGYQARVHIGYAIKDDEGHVGDDRLRFQTYQELSHEDRMDRP